MLLDHDLNLIRECAAAYEVGELFLFGSSLRNPETANDIDLGVLGIEPSRFFAFYGDLLMKLDKPVDLVDLSESSKFTALIFKHGARIYS
ncbi:MAG: hypothetical protein AAB354_15070 [candidate division KSB1 bacterium]